MRNNKGFTLMELLVAVFIASMVTIALMMVWKAASMQTSQGQRQTIVRNNLSILMRALHRDITESDLILAPERGTSGGLIVLARNAYLIKQGVSYTVTPNLISYSKDPEGVQIESEPILFAYCVHDGAIRRSEDIKLVGKDESSLLKSSLISEAESNCTASSTGRIYMDYVKESDFDVSTADNINYRFQITVHKDFPESDSPPIHLEVDKTFTKAGGA